MISRRELLRGAAASILAAPLAEAQQAGESCSEGRSWQS
jgi:hypothetical protein